VPLVPPANGAGEVGISPARAAHWGETPAQEKKMRPLSRARVPESGRKFRTPRAGRLWMATAVARVRAPQLRG
jgi:hypothetical protein